MLFPKGTVALVTGAGRGIGRATAVELAREGADVLVNYRQDADAAKETVRLIEAEGGQATAVAADISEEESVRELFRQVKATYGKLDVLVANAGVARDRHLIAMSADRFREVVDTNMFGTFLCCREAVRLMQQRRSGAIVNVSSAMGIYGGFAGQTNYAASKGGVISFTKTLANEVARHGIRVNAVAPGFVETEMTGVLPIVIRRNYLARIVMRRMGKPEEIAHVITFLASSRASYITGSVFEAHGGGLDSGDI